MAGVLHNLQINRKASIDPIFLGWAIVRVNQLFKNESDKLKTI